MYSYLHFHTFQHISQHFIAFHVISAFYQHFHEKQDTYPRFACISCIFMDFSRQVSHSVPLPCNKFEHQLVWKWLSYWYSFFQGIRPNPLFAFLPAGRKFLENINLGVFLTLSIFTHFNTISCKIRQVSSFSWYSCISTHFH